MTLLLPKVHEFLVLCLTFEQEDINRRQVRDVSVSLKLLTDLGPHNRDWQFHLIQVDHVGHLEDKSDLE